MRRLTPKEIRFLLWFAVSRLPKALLRDMQGEDIMKRERAVDLVTWQPNDLDGHSFFS
jgi:hypothetical protein